MIRAIPIYVAAITCAILHGRDGRPIRIIPEQIAAIMPFKDGTANTVLVTTGPAMYVRESAEQVAAALANAKACK